MTGKTNSAKKNASGVGFGHFAARVSNVLGSQWAFLIAIAIILVWALTGPLYHYSNTWQQIINTGTTIITFLMVFLIQNAQNRDAAAMQAKLDEIIRAIEPARGQFIGLEHRTGGGGRRGRTARGA